MARRGLNCTLSYSDGVSLRTYRVRADMASHGVVMVYEESASRTVRAFYPHRPAESPFQINVVLIGQAERTSFTNWLDGYATFVMDRDLASSKFPPMVVNIPSRKFLKVGVPLTGYEYGDHVGSMVWNHNVTFESVPSQVNPNSTSRTIAITTALDPATSFFYPFSEVLSGDQAPKVYTQVIKALAQSEPELSDEIDPSSDPQNPRFGRPMF